MQKPDSDVAVMQSAPDRRGLADDPEELEPEKGLSQRLGRG
jgi:hypothetical protein